jgi:predicted N-acetyltransferase YhbS
MDMLIPLHRAGLVPVPEARPGAVLVRRPLAPEHDGITRWVAKSFSPGWSSEARAALSNRPTTLFIAQRDNALLGFSCYDATARGFVGPIGVLESERGKGLGAALLLACLHDMRTMGYGYAVAGWVGEPEFFRKVAGAIEIPDSTPGIYAHMLR